MQLTDAGHLPAHRRPRVRGLGPGGDRLVARRPGRRRRALPRRGARARLPPLRPVPRGDRALPSPGVPMPSGAQFCSNLPDIMDSLRVTIVGGGAAAVIAARHLLTTATDPIDAPDRREGRRHRPGPRLPHDPRAAHAQQLRRPAQRRSRRPRSPAALVRAPRSARRPADVPAPQAVRRLPHRDPHRRRRPRGELADPDPGRGHRPGACRPRATWS